jgi:hypothetical protein
MTCYTTQQRDGDLQGYMLSCWWVADTDIVNAEMVPFSLSGIYTNKATRQQLMIQIASNPDRHGLTVSSAAFNSTARSLKSSIITRHVNMHACYFTLGHQRIRQAHAPHVNETGHSPWQGIDAFGLSPWQGLNIIYIYMDIIMLCKVFSLSSWNCLLSQTFEYYYA